MDDAEEIEMRLSNRWHEGKWVVQECHKYVGFVAASEFPYPNQAAVDQIAAAVAYYESLEGERDLQLLAVEDLADLVVRVHNAGELSSRTLPTDAVEPFYEIGSGGRYYCSGCGQRPMVIPYDVGGHCFHCYYEQSI